jgi:hypothetical protein
MSIEDSGTRTAQIRVHRGRPQRSRPAGLTTASGAIILTDMMRGIRNFVFSWWGWVLMGAIVLFWICILAVIMLGPRWAVVDYVRVLG